MSETDVLYKNTDLEKTQTGDYRGNNLIKYIIQK